MENQHSFRLSVIEQVVLRDIASKDFASVAEIKLPTLLNRLLQMELVDIDVDHQIVTITDHGRWLLMNLPSWTEDFSGLSQFINENPDTSPDNLPEGKDHYITVGDRNIMVSNAIIALADTISIDVSEDRVEVFISLK